MATEGTKPSGNGLSGTAAVMTEERFRQIEELYHAAHEGTPEEREALLLETDPELRREVESLLSHRTGGGFLDRPAIHNAAELLEDLTSLAHGACLGPYRIDGRIGEGGMGEVFRAVDTRLGRLVAIKTMPERFSTHFERECRAISSLNHPNICTLYDVGANYLVMELVEGETLAAQLQRGPLPIETVRQHGSQISAALAEAHSKGIVHRDLKPGNIMIGKSGVKVLDFGIAKSGADQTVTDRDGVMGTPAYMSPEQAEGKPADARSDIYSLGCVLYEMSTGSRPTSPRRRIPSPQLERIVSRCLEQEPGRRWQTAAELERELASVSTVAVSNKRMLAAAGILLLSLSAGAYFYFHHRPRLTEKDTIVLADFINKTGDPVFNDTLRQALAIELQQSPFLSVISESRIRKALALMGQPKDARLTPEIAQQVCERTSSAAILEGSIASLGSQYVLSLLARNCNTGGILDQEQIQAGRREDVVNSVSQIARKFRTRVGESLTTVEKYSTPLAEATTSSLEALKAYSTGLKVNISAGSAASIPFYRRAVEIDPKFALAYANLGLVYSDTGKSVLAAESTEKAWRLRDRVSDREKFFIDFTYDRQVTGNLEKAYQTLELWFQNYPRGEDPSALDLLAGLSVLGTGRYERAIETAKQKLAANPDFVFGYGGLALSYYYTDRFPEAESTIRQASERKLDNPNFMALGYTIAVLKGDKDQMARVMALARISKGGAEHRLAHAEALALVRSGHLQDARQSSTRAVDLALQEGDREAAASYRAARAVWEAVCGNAVESKENVRAALELSRARDVQYAAGLGLAFSGDFARSEALARDLEKHFPEDTFVKFTYAPVLHALAALERGRSSDAVERLQIALRYELAVNGLNFNHLYLGGLHSAYVRGEALAAAHRYAEAAAEFQKILDHRGIVGSDPVGALAHLRLGRTFASSGDNSKAKPAYAHFLALWKYADPDVPILKQAKAEYLKLP